MQDALLKQVCKRAKVTGAQLDRILFNNYKEIQEYLKSR
jgi:hypothetical protein